LVSIKVASAVKKKFSFFYEMDEIWGTRADVSPVCLSHSTELSGTALAPVVAEGPVFDIPEDSQLFNGLGRVRLRGIGMGVFGGLGDRNLGQHAPPTPDVTPGWQSRQDGSQTWEKLNMS